MTTEVTDVTDVEPVEIPGQWGFNYTYFAGDAASRFFAELRENKRVMGTRCPRCERVLVPARSFCDACFERTTEWVPVANVGTLETFTIITAAFPGLPEPPVVLAYVTLDGADTALVNVVTGVDCSDIDAAAAILAQQPRVRLSFTDQPKGRITDFTFVLED
ncbi:MAG: hypothetical protein JWO46_887 [Nocardioidaceae bacterium]|nr:hypothetical protein [Nocardioidaceae bacterium]